MPDKFSMERVSEFFVSEMHKGHFRSSVCYICGKSV